MIRVLAMKNPVLTLSAALTLLSLGACAVQPEVESASTPLPTPSASPSAASLSSAPTVSGDAEKAGEAYRKRTCLDMIAGVTDIIPVVYEKYRCDSFENRASEGDRPSEIAEDGIWKIGEDFPAGTYRVTASVSGMGCYWKKSSDPEGDEIISNDLPAGGRPQVSLKKGQWFTTERCGVWEKVS